VKAPENKGRVTLENSCIWLPAKPTSTEKKKKEGKKLPKVSTDRTIQLALWSRPLLKENGKIRQGQVRDRGHNAQRRKKNKNTRENIFRNQM